MIQRFVWPFCLAVLSGTRLRIPDVEDMHPFTACQNAQNGLRKNSSEMRWWGWLHHLDHLVMNKFAMPWRKSMIFMIFMIVDDYLPIRNGDFPLVWNYQRIVVKFWVALKLDCFNNPGISLCWGSTGIIPGKPTLWGYSCTHMSSK